MLPGTDRDTCLIFPLVSTTIWVLMVSAFFFPEYPEPVSLRSVLCSVASTTNFRISSSLKSVFSVGISKTDSTTGRTLAKYLQIALSWISNNAERNIWVVYDRVYRRSMATDSSRFNTYGLPLPFLILRGCRNLFASAFCHNGSISTTNALNFSGSMPNILENVFGLCLSFEMFMPQVYTITNL